MLMIKRLGPRLVTLKQSLPPLGRLRKLSTDIEEIKQESDSNESDISASATGVIDKTQSEVLLYYDNIYPLGTSNSAFKQYFRMICTPLLPGHSPEEIGKRVREISEPLPENVKISELVPLRRDCGAFIKFQFPPEITARDVVGCIQTNVKKNDEELNKGIFKYVLNLVWNQSPAVYPVKGTPWIEDLRRFPSSRLRVKFEGEKLTEEELYLLFRRYGVIIDIKPGDEATVIYRNLRSAVCAKNCVTGISVNKGKSVLHLQYIPIKRVNYVTDFILNHQKITIPILLALLATVAVLIFDPVREWSIELKITKKYTFDHYKDNQLFKFVYIPYKTISNWLTDGYDYIDEHITQFQEDTDDISDDSSQNSNLLWSERFEKSKQLKLWIYENINTFIIVKGPKGSGKEEFVLDHTLHDDELLSQRILYIDCDNISKCRSDNSLISETSNQLGYFPVFTWTNSISQFIDLGVQGLTGQKSGLSESIETQFKNMFLLTSLAIRNIALADYEKYKNAVIKKNSKLKDGEEIELLKEDEYLQQHPEAKPIIIVNKFARKSDTNKNDFMYQMIADWTSGLIQNNMAHVIYITSDVGSIQHLNDALPNQVFKTITLSDASSGSAQQYLLSQLKLSDVKSVLSCLEPLGGRMLDLQAFIRRIKSGESPDDALSEMVSQAAEQITTFFLNNQKLQDDNNWNTAQVWHVMKLLSGHDQIDYDELIKSPLFKSSNETRATLSTLEKHDLISLKRDKGILNKITAGRPLFKAAFKNLIDDLKIYKLYEVDLLNNLLKLETDKIKKVQDELVAISPMGARLEKRIQFLAQKIEVSNSKIIALEEKIVEIGKIDSEPESKRFLGIKYN